MMHKKLYASGFLYHLPSHQILLQQQTPSETSILSSWFLLSRLYTEKEEPENVFKEIILDLFDRKIDKINHVYSYVNERTNKNQVIFYGEINEFQNYSPKNGLDFSWFSFKDILKLQITEQSKHDILVGQRVIDAASRASRGIHTFQ